MNELVKSFLVKNHSAAFLMLVGAELEDYDIELSNEFIFLANKKREYEELLLKTINKLDKSNIIFTDILQKAYYDYDDYITLEDSTNKEELQYLIEMLKKEEAILNNKNEILRSYLRENGKL